MGARIADALYTTAILCMTVGAIAAAVNADTGKFIMCAALSIPIVFLRSGNRHRNKEEF